MFNLFRHLEKRASCVRNWKIFRYSRYILFEKMSQEELLNLSLYDLHIQRAKKSLSSKTYHEIQLSSVTQSCLTLSDPWTAAHQASLSITKYQSLLRLMSIESVMLSNHLILCSPHLLLLSVFPSISVFSNESVLCIRWPKYWSFRSASVLPMNIQDWFPLGCTGRISLLSKRL